MKKFLLLICLLVLLMPFAGCVDNMFKDIHNLIYDGGVYSCKVDTKDETNISYVQVEITEISEYESSKFGNSFKQNLKWVTGQNEERYLKAEMLLKYFDGQEEVLNLKFKAVPEQYDTILFDVENSAKWNRVKVVFTYNGNLATSKYEGNYSNGIDVHFQIGTEYYTYDLSYFQSYHTHGVRKGDFTKQLLDVQQSTCQKQGYQKVKCSECNYEIVERLPLVTHKYENGQCTWCNNGKLPAHYFYTGYSEKQASTTLITSSEQLMECFADESFINVSKDTILGNYNDSYFENKSLAHVSLYTSSSCDYNVTKVSVAGDTIYLYYDVISPLIQDDDYVLINILVEVDCKASGDTQIVVVRNVIDLKEYQHF